MQRAGFKRTRWAWRSSFSHDNLDFSPDLCVCLEQKHMLAKLVEYYCSHVMPKTYVLDEYNWSTCLSSLANEYYPDLHDMQDKIDGLSWILKPALLNNGQQIRIFDCLSQLEAYFLRRDRLAGPYVLQRYISEPDLINGCKYSLRFFVVITQEHGAFLYRQGYMNVALATYIKHDFSNLSAHLTNEHLNEHVVSVAQIPTAGHPDYRHWYAQIRSLVKTVMNGAELAFPQAFLAQKDRTFAIFGFDFMLDSKKNVWLLEVNHGPCFPVEAEHPLQLTLYQQFWEAMIKQFVNPIALQQPIKTHGCVGFDCLSS